MGGRMVVTQIKGPVDVSIKNTDGRVKVVHVNRLQPHVRREGNGIQNLNQSLIRTDRNKITEINNSLNHYRSLCNVTEKNHTLQEANNTSIRMDGSLRDWSSDDIVPIDS